MNSQNIKIKILKHITCLLFKNKIKNKPHQNAHHGVLQR